MIEIDLMGTMYTDRAVLAHLERSRGYVLNIASTAGALRGPGMSGYCAAKAGVESLSDCVAPAVDEPWLVSPVEAGKQVARSLAEYDRQVAEI